MRKIKLGHTACTFSFTLFLYASLCSLYLQWRKCTCHIPNTTIFYFSQSFYDFHFTQLVSLSFSLDAYSLELNVDVRTIEWQYRNSKRKIGNRNRLKQTFFSLVHPRLRRRRPRRDCGCFIGSRRADTKIRVYSQCTAEYTRNRV